MATSSTISTVLSTIFRDELIKQANRSSPALAFLEKRGGRNSVCTWPVTGTGATAAAYNETDAFTSPTTDKRVQAKLDWALYKSEFQVTGFAEAIAAATGSPAELANLFRREVMNAGAALGSQINTHFYNGAEAASPNQVVGLNEGLDDGTNTNVYAAINRTTDTFWKGNLNHNSGTGRALSLSLLRTLKSKIFRGSGETLADYVIFAPPELLDKYAELFDASRDYVTEIVVPGRGQITLDGGYEVAKFGGALFVADKDVPYTNNVAPTEDVSQCYFVNPRHVHWEIVPSIPSQIGAGGEVNQVEDLMAGQRAVTNFPITVQLLGPTGDFTNGFVKTYIQLVVERPNATGILKDINIGQV